METISLKTVSTIDALCDNLEQDIYSLYFPPGSKITENILTSRYGVSRNTVREAITFLLANGLLMKVANKGIYVREISLDDIREIFHLRGLLEAEAIKIVIASETIPAELVRQAEKVQAIDPNENWDANIKADLKFHQLLVQATGSSRLIRLYNSLFAEVKLCIYQSRSFSPGRPENAIHHLEILSAMEKGDLDGALKWLDHHMKESIKSYTLNYQSRNNSQKESSEE